MLSRSASHVSRPSSERWNRLRARFGILRRSTNISLPLNAEWPTRALARRRRASRAGPNPARATAIDALQSLRGLVESLLDLSSGWRWARERVRAAHSFSSSARGGGEPARRLRVRFRLPGSRKCELPAPEEDTEGISALGWRGRCRTRRGRRPRAACGPPSRRPRSGRRTQRAPHTFIVGLDDGRFPGAGLQDPILLDEERKRLSKNLRTSSGELARRIDLFAVLFARLRGTITLSYSCYDLADDREMFPARRPFRFSYPLRQARWRPGRAQ